MRRFVRSTVKRPSRNFGCKRNELNTDGESAKSQSGRRAECNAAAVDAAPGHLTVPLEGSVMLVYTLGRKRNSGSSR